MRSATNNRFINVWQYTPGGSDSCAIANTVWTLAEVSAKQTSGATGSAPLGSYFWPYTEFTVKGPAKQTADAEGDITCTPTTTPTQITEVEIFCGSSLGVCASVDKLAGCDADDWALKFGLQWEQSFNGGTTWFRLPETSLNLNSNKIAIGIASPQTGPPIVGYAARANPPAYFDDAVQAALDKTQFYGVIDSIRISRGTARYRDPICVPYNPLDKTENLIDKYVVFALNIGVNEYQVPGGKIFPYYLHNRGWLVPNMPVYEGNNDIVAPEIRNLLLDPSTQIDTDANANTPAVDFYDAHKFLCYSTRDAGYRGRCGISFPSTLKAHDAESLASSVTFAQGLFLEDVIVPPPLNRLREIFAAAATTENLVTDFNARIWGNKRRIDGKKDYAAGGGSSGKIFLVKDQDNPEENGIYVVVNQGGDDGYLWERVPFGNGNNAPDNYENARIFITDGTENAGTVWHSTTENATLDETPITFVQEQSLGVYRDDFCVEAYFKVGGFLHANATETRAGENMTLLDTYYGDPRDGTPKQSGLRIYFKPVQDEHTGQVVVDIGPYNVDESDSIPDISEPLKGPALRSKTIKANVFYHVAVTRHHDIFRLYVDGVLQDQFIAQDKTYSPKNRTKEQNYILYRARGFFGTRWSQTSAPAQFLVRQSEFYFDRESSPYTYALRFNGAAGMLKSGNTSDQFLNLAGYHPDPAVSSLLSYPGSPIPDYPADSHVYIYNNIRQAQENINFSFVPNLRFPRETITVEAATAPADAEYANAENEDVPVPGRGNISLSGLFKQGSPAYGEIKLVFSTLAARTLPKLTRFMANGVTFMPRLPLATNPSQAPTGFNIVTSGQSTLNLLLQSDSAVPPNYFVIVPVVATSNSENGNLSPGDSLTLASHFGSVRVATTQNIPTLSGLLTVDGVTVSVDDRVLVKNQINKAQNGIYVASASAWQRAADMNDTADVLYGASVRVNAGTANAGKVFFVANTSFLTLDVSDIDWVEYLFNLVSAAANISFQGGVGDFTSDDLIIDGVVIKDGTRILVKDQLDASTNGVYIARLGVWERAAELDSSDDLRKELRVFVKGGYTSTNTAYNKSFTGSIPDVVPPRVLIGVTPFTFLPDNTPDSDADIIASAQDGYCAGEGLVVSDELSVRVDCVTTANISLNGIPPASATDGFQTTDSPANMVFVRAQTNPRENGIYFSSSGSWRRVRFLNRTDQFLNNLIVAPVAGNTRGTALTPKFAYRMYIPENFELDSDQDTRGHITSSATPEALEYLHLPLNFDAVEIEDIKPDLETGIPGIAPGTEISFTDFLQSGVGIDEDMHVWRLKFKCGNTLSYSRNIIVRLASKLTVLGEPVDSPAAIGDPINTTTLDNKVQLVRSTN